MLHKSRIVVPNRLVIPRKLNLGKFGSCEDSDLAHKIAEVREEGFNWNRFTFTTYLT